ncbi:MULTISPECIES: fimbria/pilus outer membrane usher protein [Hyphomonas]|nr:MULTISPECIES: fimbria/pilus outer membrane usher protein [Hyphomonas]
MSAAMAARAAPETGTAPADVMAETLSLLVEARINGAPVAGLVALDLLADGCVRIETGPLRNAGLYSENAPAVCLQSLAGIDYSLDQGAAQLDIYAARAPPPRRVVFDRQQFAKPLSGVMGGYGLSAQRVHDGSDERVNAFGDLSLTLHTPHGRLQNEMVATYDDGEGQAQRLLTVYERDFPGSFTRLSVGDSFTRAPRWGRLTAIAGVQYGTDFSMDPNDSWRPYRTFQALLRQQSEVDVRVNGVVRQKQSVAPGYTDFEISPEAGLNEVEVTIQEANGLSRIEDYSFFSSPEVLAAGVTDYSVSLGVPRRFTGISATYDDQIVANGLVRRGLSDRLTAEAYSELGHGGGLLGGGSQITAGKVGVLSLSAGLSRNEAGHTGHIVSAGFERNTRRGSFQLQARFADPQYSDAASALGAPFPDRSIRASGGIYTPAGSLRASFVDEEDGVLSDRRFLSVGWEKPLRGDRFSFSATAYQDFARSETGFAIALRASFGAYNAGSSYQSARGQEASSVQVSRSRMPGERVQWAMRAADGGAGAVYQGDLAADLGVADLVLNGGVYGETNQLMAGVRGGFAVTPGARSLHRQTTGASAIVRIPELKGLPIYKDNRIVAVTGQNGIAVIPDVRPYEVNTLSLRPEDVPLEYEVSDFNARFVPRRGVSEVRFDVRRETVLAFTVVAEGGAPLAPGSRVELLRSGLVCPVGLEGRVYCSVAEESDIVAVTTPAGRFIQPVAAVRSSGEMQLRPEGRVEMAGID